MYEAYLNHLMVRFDLLILVLILPILQILFHLNSEEQNQYLGQVHLH
jgi:hypothetical protein